MNLINPLDSVERCMSAKRLERHPAPGAVYGCGPVVAGEAVEEVLRAAQNGEYLGIASLTMTEEIVNSHQAHIRGALGAILGAGMPAFMADQQSIEWAGHLALANVRLSGVHVAWGATAEDAFEGLRGGRCLVQHLPTMPDEWRLFMRWNHPLKDALGLEAPLFGFTSVVSVDDVGVAIACAILEIPCLYFCTHHWGKTARVEYNPLVRWAREHGVSGNLCFDRDELDRKMAANDVAPVSRELVSLRAQQVDDMLAVLAHPTARDPLAVLDTKAPGKLLELGSVFDPATHYCEDYYGGSNGLRYHLPNGEIRYYSATAHAWGGFSWVAETLHEQMGAGSLLDLGCGAGGFVKEALAVGFDAKGVDISEAAIKRADPVVAGRLFVQDITRRCSWDRDTDFVTALDLWEHIYAQDVPELIRAVHRTLRPGGIGFFVICTRGDGEDDWTITPGTKVTLENSWLLVSGHVTIRTWGWWAAMFEAHGFKIRRDLGHDFQVLRAEDPALRGADSWSARNTMFCEAI